MDALSRYNPSPLTMQQLVEFGKTATEPDSFHFLKKEVPVRLANIMKEINLLPSSLLAMPSVIDLQVWPSRVKFGRLLIHIKSFTSWTNFNVVSGFQCIDKQSISFTKTQTLSNWSDLRLPISSVDNLA